MIVDVDVEFRDQDGFAEFSKPIQDLYQTLRRGQLGTKVTLQAEAADRSAGIQQGLDLLFVSILVGLCDPLTFMVSGSVFWMTVSANEVIGSRQIEMAKK